MQYKKLQTLFQKYQVYNFDFDKNLQISKSSFDLTWNDDFSSNIRWPILLLLSEL